MTEEIPEKTEKPAEKVRGKPFQKGEDPRRNTTGQNKGSRSFKTDLKLAIKEVAEALRLQKRPDKVYVQLIITGLKEALKGNYAFWNKFMESFYEEMREKKGFEIPPEGMGIIFLPRRKQDENKQLKKPNGVETPAKTRDSVSEG